MLELQILGFNVLLPTLVMAAAWLLVHRWRPGGKQPAGSARLASVVVFAGGASIIAAMLFRVEVCRTWFPEDAWARLPHAVGIVSLSSMVALFFPRQSWGWLLKAAALGLGLFLAAGLVIPSGEAWEFLQPRVPIWLSLLVAAPLLAWCLAARLNDRWPGVLGLGWIACVIAAAFLSQDFLRVTEPLLAVASVLGMSGLLCLTYRLPQLVSAVAPPMLFAMSAAVANAQFNSFHGFPDSLSWLAMAAPSLAALSTLMIPNAETADGKLQPGRVVWVIAACVALALIVVVWTAVAGGAGGSSDEW